MTDQTTPQGHAGVMGGPPSVPHPHAHDSRRLDGWLDTHCMYCGGRGYWRDGEEVGMAGFETKVHPSGKVLIREVK